MIFYKVLSNYYEKWYRDCMESAVYCRQQGNNQQAECYEIRAKAFFELINTHWWEISFYKLKDNAFLYAEVTDPQFEEFLLKEFTN